jgi:hypothetical protein
MIHYHQARISDELVWDGPEDEVVVPSDVQVDRADRYLFPIWEEVTVLRTCPG